MFGMKTPDITLAQITAALSWVLAQALAMGVIDNNQNALFLQIGSTLIAGVWTIADSIIRAGRAKAAAAAITAANTAPVLLEATTSSGSAD